MYYQTSRRDQDGNGKARFTSPNRTGYQGGGNNGRFKSPNRKQYGKGMGKSWLEVYEGLGSERYTYFWRNESPFSQHYPASFNIEGVTYNCAEQYYMAQKAEMFGDEEKWEEIMWCRDPMMQKSIARGVKGFNQALWYKDAKKVVRRATIAKFSEHKNILMILLSTRGTTLVEASPRDKRWGFGMEADNPCAIQRTTWNGTNWLGEVLSEVRDTYFESQTYDRHFFTDLPHNPKAPPQQYSGFSTFYLPSSPFSPDHISIFVVDQKPFTSLLHFLAFSAANGDAELGGKVLALMDMQEVRNVMRGKLISFNREHLIIGNFHKFEQNEGLKAQLLSTKDTILCYKKPYDPLCTDTKGGDFELGWLLTYMRDKWVREGNVDLDDMLANFSASHIPKNIYDYAISADKVYQRSRSTYDDTSSAKANFKEKGAFLHNQSAFKGVSQVYGTGVGLIKGFGQKMYGQYSKRDNDGSYDKRSRRDERRWEEKGRGKNGGGDTERGSRERGKQNCLEDLSGGKRNSEAFVSYEEGKEKKKKDAFIKNEPPSSPPPPLQADMNYDVARPPPSQSIHPSSFPLPLAPHLERNKDGMNLCMGKMSKGGWSPVSEFSSSSRPSHKFGHGVEEVGSRWSDGGINREEEISAGDEGMKRGWTDDPQTPTPKQDDHTVAMEDSYTVGKEDSFNPCCKIRFKFEGRSYPSVLNYLAYQKAFFFKDTDKMEDIASDVSFSKLSSYLSKLGDDGDWLKEEERIITTAYQSLMAENKGVLVALKRTAKCSLKVNVNNERLSDVLAAVLMKIRS